MAVVVPREGATPDGEALIDWSRDHLAGFKRPREIVFLAAEEMPRNATGKVLHHKLRERLGRGHG